MRLIDLFETPITDYSFQGDDEPNTLQKLSTIKLAKSPAAKAKAIRMFQKTPYKIRILFLNEEDTEVYYRTDATGKSHYSGRIEHPKFPPFPGEITFIINSDYGDDFVPFTPWMIAHRMGHVVYQTSSSFAQLFSDFAFELEQLNLQFEELMSKHGGWKNGVLSQMGKFKSARENNFNNFGEFFLDCFAQYLIQGKVSFNEVHNPIIPYWTTSNRKPEDYVKMNPDKYKPIKLSDNTIKGINQFAKKQETDLNNGFKKSLDSLVGKVIAI